MYFRKLALLLGILSTLLSAPFALALGLGEITLRSSLNQPLNAEISLVDVGDLSAEQIIVKLASQDDFDRVGLERPFFYSKMKFEVVTQSSHGPFIRLTTREAAVEPFLSFIVEARWSSGRLLHEYTVLLDLPTFSDKKPASVQTAMPSGLPSGKTEPVRQPSTQVSAVSANRTSGQAEGDVLVGQNDTLWEIALEVRRGNASVYQTMMALQRANPHAFINNNINLLRAGQVLRIPSVSEIESVNTRQAQGSVAQQNRQWSDNNGMAAELDASGRGSVVSRTSSDASGRVRLAASDNGSGSAGNGSGSTQELAQVEEELARSRSENDELRSRATDLEEQIKTMESLLEVSNTQMRALELAAEESNNAVEDALETDVSDVVESIDDAVDTTVDAIDTTIADAVDVVEDTLIDPVVESVDEAADTISDALDDSDATSEFVMDDESEEEAQEVVEDIQAPVVRKAPEPSLMDKVMDNILWIVGGIAALLFAGIMMLRKSGDDGFEDDFIDDLDNSDSTNIADDLSEEVSDEFEMLADDLGDDSDDIIPDVSVEAETGDVVSEADIYISLEQYDQAESMLQKGLAESPNSLPIQLKLMEVFAGTQSLQSFDALYANVLQSDDATSILKAQGLRAEFTDAPEFNAEPSISIDDDFEALELEIGSDEADSEPGLDLDLDLNLDLDEESFDLDEESDATEDFSLGLDDELASEPELSLDLESDDDLSLALDDATDDLSLEGLDDLDLDLGVTEDGEITELELDDLDLSDALGESGEQLEVAVEDFTSELESSPDALQGGEALEELSEALVDVDVADELGDLAEEAIELTDDSADVFDLDTAMDDLDLDALDKEMADLDAGSVDNVADLLLLDSDDDDVFDAALLDTSNASIEVDDLPTPEEAAAVEDSDDEDLDFLADSDEAATKLDLARAYVDMGDVDGAKDILSEVLQEGNEAQQADAESLLERINS